MTIITDKLMHLAQKRAELEGQKEIVKRTQERLENSMLWKDLQLEIDIRKHLETETSELEALIKQEAVAAFDGNKHPLTGIEIKSFSVVTITDQKSALKWIAENAPTCLKIDEGKFKKIADTLELPFVDKKDENRAQIASDLSSYLENKNE